MVNGIADLPASATWFDSKKAVGIRMDNNNLVLSLPDECPNSYYATIDLHFRKPPKQMPKHSLKNDQIRLTPFQGITSDLKKNYIPYVFGIWYSTNAEIEFNVYLEAGKYTVEAEYSAWYNGGEMYLKIDDKEYTGYYKNTGDSSKPNDMGNYIVDDLGGIKIDIPVSKKYSIKLKRNDAIPNLASWMNVRSFTLKKLPDTGISKMSPVIIYPIFITEGYFMCESPLEQWLKIYDAKGILRKTDKAGNYKRVDVETLESGMYIVKGENFTRRILIRAK